MKRAELKAAAKFRAICECGKKSPRFATATTTDWWMRKHEQDHRLGSEVENGKDGN